MPHDDHDGVGESIGDSWHDSRSTITDHPTMPVCRVCVPTRREPS